MEMDARSGTAREFPRYAPKPGATYYRSEPLPGRNGSSLRVDRAQPVMTEPESVSGGGEMSEMMQSLHDVELQIDEAGRAIKTELQSLGDKASTPQATRAPGAGPGSWPGDGGRRNVAGADRQRLGAYPPRRPQTAQWTPQAWPSRQVSVEPEPRDSRRRRGGEPARARSRQGPHCVGSAQSCEPRR